MNFLNALFVLLADMSPYLLLGFVVAGILHAAVPHRLYRTYLSGNDLRSVLYSALFGVPLPLCSCGVIPTAMSLYREGASRGAVTSFLIATPQTGVDSILATYSLLGLPFAILRPVVAFVTGIGGGLAVNRSIRHQKETTPESTVAGEACEVRRFKSPIWESLYYGFVTMLQDIGKWFVLGLLIAAVITVAVPDDFFVQFASMPLVSMLAVLAASVPMYVCATGSIPIAAALMLKGLTPGAALVLLMAGPATNVATLLVIHKVLGRRTMWIYLLTIVAGALGFGLFIDLCLPSSWFVVTGSGMSCHAMVMPLWKWGTAILFTLLIVNAFVMKYVQSYKNRKMMNEKQLYRIGGMTCNHCKMNVEKSLKAIDGVTDAVVDLPSGTAAVEGTATQEEIKRAVEAIGYDFLGKK